MLVHAVHRAYRPKVEAKGLDSAASHHVLEVCRAKLRRCHEQRRLVTLNEAREACCRICRGRPNLTPLVDGSAAQINRSQR